VLLMAEEGPDVELAARTAGATGWLIKPFRREELESALESLLERDHADPDSRISGELPLEAPIPAPPIAE
ncbi:MAG: hypothetical protein H5U40_00265, partial [Polyangiaceae bacterium]|nr:hypothetical protein [Polyangiaceae bacterium]